MENIYYNIIKSLIKNIYNSNFELFYNENSNLSTFLSNPKSQTLLSHFSITSITDNQYNIIIEKLRQKYVEQINTNVQAEPQIEGQQLEDKPKVRVKGNNRISGFIDALIIAFITGSFIGIILLNIYSKIAQHI